MKVYKNGLTRKEMIDMYQDGVSTAIIAEDFGITTRGVLYIMNKEGVPTKRVGQPRKYNVNEDFFKTWSNEMAYVLGLLMADGHINKQLHAIYFYHNDIKILERVANFMQADNQIKKREDTNGYMLTINSKEIRKDLIKLDVPTGNKSAIITMPKVPKNYLPCFIRGFFDGDGYADKSGYNATITTVSEKFAKELLNILSNWDINTRVTKDKNYEIFRVRISGKHETKKTSQDYL